MQVLVIGGGGREHALVWKLLQSPQVTQVYCAPGNVGISQLPRTQVVPLMPTDVQGLLRLATVHGISLTVVGPEVPLAEGIVDHFQAAGIPIFGPTQAGAQIETSKAWAKTLMREAGIPTAAYQVFTQLDPALAYVREQDFPLVIKADGLAAGKGVIIVQNLAEAQEALEALLGGSLGQAGQTVVIEAFLSGEEASLLALSDGTTCLPLLAAQDHKRIGEGDTGSNTGGMGAYAPAHHLVTPEVMARIQSRILDPTLAALRERGIIYRGVLYAGLMINAAGDPSVVEFNCRFGDPETQVVLPLLRNPLEQVLLACVEGKLETVQLEWHSGSAACVVMASQGYPGDYAKGKPIQGLNAAAETGALIFHAGTRWTTPNPRFRSEEGSVLTDGGRVLCVTGQGSNLSQALDQAYTAVRRIQFEGAYYRNDIGFRAKAGSPAS